MFRTFGVETPEELYSLVVSNPTARARAAEMIIEDGFDLQRVGYSELSVLGAWAQAESALASKS